MTTLITAPEAKAVRCDRCRLVWPLTPGSDTGWLEKDDADFHLCPRCRDQAPLTPDERAGVERGSASAKRLLALKGPGRSG
jgi:hypothetical protein